MAAPTTWSAPASSGTVNADASHVSYADGYWFAISYTNGSAVVPVLRYATDPAGAWSTATLPANPVSYPYVYGAPLRHGVVSSGTQFAFVLTYRDSALTATETYAIHATDPSGAWTATQVGVSTNLIAADAIYADGKFVAVGRGALSNLPWIAYATAADASWTINSTQATTGYDPAADWRVEGIDYDGSQWVTVATGPGTDGSRYSSSLTSSWGTASGFPTTLGTGKRLRYEADVPVWTVSDVLNVTYYYATDPTGSWGSVGTALTGMTDQVDGLTYGNGYWVAAGATQPGFDTVPRMAYLAGTSPSGTYTTITNPFSNFGAGDESVYDVAYSGNYFVAISRFYSELRYCFIGATTGPTYLRQRQSPVRTPSRVRGADLRQRQTPFVT